MKKQILFFVLIFCFLKVFSQSKQIIILSDSVNFYRELSLNAPEEDLRYSYNVQVQAFLEAMLYSKNAVNQNFEALKSISVIMSQDKQIRLVTWMVPKDNKQQEYFGFLQVFDIKAGTFSLYNLNDYRANIFNPERQILDPNTWYGAVYYQIIPVENSSKKTVYTLLGWNQNDIFTDIKLIEILSFKPNGQPQFGADIFKKSPYKGNRIIFKYHKGASFNLNFEKHRFYTGKKDSQGKSIEEETQIIVFEQLIPVEEKFAKIPEFYTPESSMMQGFIFNDGKWTFIPSIISGRDITIKDVKVSDPSKVQLKEKDIKKRNWYQP